MKRDIGNALGIAACIILIGLFLSACETTGTPRIEPQIVNVPIPVPCRADIGPEPEYPDTDAAIMAAPNIFVWVQLMKAGRLMRIARDREKTAALDACRGAP